MRDMAWVLIALVLPATSAHAQKSAAHRTANVPVKRDPLPRFTIAPRGAALAPIGLPLPPIGLPPNRATRAWEAPLPIPCLLVARHVFLRA